jgi:thiosulfate/3-mercaptopyruvate sulfurtransferase
MDAATSTNVLVSPEWVAAHADDPKVRLIEVAGLGQDEMQAYRAGHVPGATGWKWKDMLWDSHMREFPSPEAFAKRLGEAGIGNDTTVVFYGEAIQFGIYAWWTFRYCGHADVRLLDGGRNRWQAEGRPLTTEVPAQPGGPDVGAVRYGRIPGARHLYYGDLLKADNSFKPAAELAALIGAHAAAPDVKVIAYCRMSHRATVVHFALTQILGFTNVRVYDGSWTEWGNLVGVPVER